MGHQHKRVYTVSHLKCRVPLFGLVVSLLYHTRRVGLLFGSLWLLYLKFRAPLFGWAASFSKKISSLKLYTSPTQKVNLNKRFRRYVPGKCLTYT